MNVRFNDLNQNEQSHLDDFVDCHVLYNQTTLINKALQDLSFELLDIHNVEGGYGSLDEIYEWWLVDGYLARKLQEQDESVISEPFGDWWGRKATGQRIILDQVIIRIWAHATDLNLNKKTNDSPSKR